MKLVFDLAALISRVTIGVIFVAHGSQKWSNGLDPTTAMFTQVGVPQPQLAAGFTTFAELVGGSLLILGLAVRLAALALLGVTLGAAIYVHARNGVFVADNGWELVGALGAACLLFVALGGGRFSIDGILRSAFGKRSERREAEREMAVVTTATTTAATPAEVPRQAEPAAPESTTTSLSDDEMKAIDRLVADEPPKKEPPTG
ncbi:DoxX family protein [Nonomuraea sp. NBC_01738]|uniref:DoxX family protein n=1 Tax=Nonomuraea sp. NBC_01738 TaxID=2976003 RepID=UPI002E0DD473|nr:DoxX family protein [Nonomuraea sp. NBC_01738]